MLTGHQLSSALEGRVVHSEDPDWEDARRAFNLRLDQRPAAVAFPSGERDVVALMTAARARGLRIAAQATGHNAGPLGALEDTILVNTGQLGDLSIDALRGRVRVGAGVRWERVVEPLSDRGLAALHGSSPDVGIVGYSLGGGIGWLARRHGMQASSVTAVELVTAEGCLRRVDAVHEPELFWALRGGGGSFGIVTAIEFAVYPVGRLYAGTMLFGFERAVEVLRAWSTMLPSLPDEMTTWSVLLHVPDVPFAPQELRGRSWVAVMSVFLGDRVQGSRLLAPIRRLEPMMDTCATVPPAALADLAMDPPEPLPYLSGHRLLARLPEEAIEELVAAAARRSQLTVVQLRHLGGALARPPRDAGARATLPGEISCFALGVVPDETMAREVGSSLRTLDEIIAGEGVGYYPSFVEQPTDAATFFDDASWERLRRVKAHYDPDDLVRGNHHVPADGLRSESQMTAECTERR